MPPTAEGRRREGGQGLPGGAGVLGVLILLAASLLALAGCDTGPEPFSADGEWAALGDPGGPPVRLALADGTLYVALGQAGLARLDVAEPGRAFEPLGFAVADPDDRADRTHGVLGLDARGRTVLLTTTALVDLGDGAPPASLFRSDDGGDTWTRSDGGIRRTGEFAGRGVQLTAVARSPHDPEVVLAGAGSMYRSTDGGRTWEIAEGDQHGVYVFGFGLAWDPGRPGVAWAYGQGNRFEPFVRRSGDGGRTWTTDRYPLGNGTPNALAFSAARPGRAWAAAGDVYVSDEGGHDWVLSPRVLPDTLFTVPKDVECEALAAHPSGGVFAGCGRSVYLAEGGRAVSVVASPNGGEVYSLLYDADGDALYVGAADGVYRLQAPLRAPREPYD